MPIRLPAINCFISSGERGKGAIRQHSPRRFRASRTLGSTTKRNCTRRFETNSWRTSSALKAKGMLAGVGPDEDRLVFYHQVHGAVEQGRLLLGRQRRLALLATLALQQVEEGDPLCGMDPRQGDDRVGKGEDGRDPRLQPPVRILGQRMLSDDRGHGLLLSGEWRDE